MSVSKNGSFLAESEKNGTTNFLVEKGARVHQDTSYCALVERKADGYPCLLKNVTNLCWKESGDGCELPGK